MSPNIGALLLILSSVLLLTAVQNTNSNHVAVKNKDCTAPYRWLCDKSETGDGSFTRNKRQSDGEQGPINENSEESTLIDSQTTENSKNENGPEPSGENPQSANAEGSEQSESASSETTPTNFSPESDTQTSSDNSGSSPESDVEATPSNSGSPSESDAETTPTNSGAPSESDAETTPNNSGSSPESDVEATPSNSGSPSESDAETTPNNSGSSPESDVEATPNNSGSPSESDAVTPPDKSGSPPEVNVEATPTNSGSPSESDSQAPPNNSGSSESDAETTPNNSGFPSESDSQAPPNSSNAPPESDAETTPNSSGSSAVSEAEASSSSPNSESEIIPNSSSSLPASEATTEGKNEPKETPHSSESDTTGEATQQDVLTTSISTLGGTDTTESTTEARENESSASSENSDNVPANPTEIQETDATSDLSSNERSTTNAIQETTSQETSPVDKEESSQATTPSQTTANSVEESSSISMDEVTTTSQRTETPNEEVTSLLTTKVEVVTSSSSIDLSTPHIAPGNSTEAKNKLESMDKTTKSSNIASITSVPVMSTVSEKTQTPSDKNDLLTLAATTMKPFLIKTEKSTTTQKPSKSSEHPLLDSFDISLPDMSPDYHNNPPLKPVEETLFDNSTPRQVSTTSKQEDLPVRKKISSPGCMHEDKERFKRTMLATVYSKLDGQPTMLSFLEDTACIGTLSKKGHQTVRSRGLLIPQLPLKLRVEAGMFMHDRLYLFDSSPEQKVWSFKYNQTKKIYSLKAHTVISVDAFLQLCGIKDFPINNFRVKAVAQFSLNDPTCIIYDRDGEVYLSTNATSEATSLANSIHYLMNTQFVNVQSIFSWMEEPISKSVYVYGSDGELYEIYRDSTSSRKAKLWIPGKYRRIPYENSPIPRTL